MKVSRGLLWTGAEKVFFQGLSFVQGVVLARMLVPGDFGLVAMLGIFLSIGQVMSESGLGSALVAMMPGAGNAKELRCRAFRWNVVASLCAYIVLVALSPAVAAFYSEPVLVPLAFVLGVAMVVNAACVADNAQLNYACRFRTLSVVNCISSAAAFAVGVVLAWIGCGVWSVAFVGVAGAVFRFVALRFAVRGGDVDVAGEEVPFRRLLRYGVRLAASGVIGTVYWDAYSLVIGRLFSPTAVGMFVRGRRWALIPGDVVDDSVGRVAFVELSHEWHGGANRFRHRAFGFLAINELLLLPILAALYVWAHEIVGFVLGDQWLECVPLLRILVLGAAFRPVAGIAENMLKASGSAGVVLKVNAVCMVAGAICLAVGAMFGGLAGICWAMTVGHVISAAAFLCCAVRMTSHRRSAHAACVVP